MNIFSGTRVRIILNIFLGLLLGTCVALMYLSSSVTFRQYLQDRIEQQFEKDYGCQFKAKLESVDFLTCSMTFSGIHIVPIVASDSDEICSIVAEKLQMKGSWLSLFVHRKLKVCLSFERMIMFETFDKVPDKLMTFCSKMFSKAIDAPVLYDLISISDGMLFFKKLSDGLSIQIPYICNMRTEHKVTRIQCYMHDGSIGYQNNNWVQNIAGSVLCDVPFANIASHVYGQVQLNFNIIKQDQQIPGFFAGKLQGGIGDFVLKTEDGSVVVDPIKINCTSTTCWCDLMIAATSQILHYFDMPDFLAEIAGTIWLSLQCDLYRVFETLQASIVLNNIMYQSKPLIPGGKMVITDHDKKGFSGVFVMNDQQKFMVQVQADEQQKKCSIYNVIDFDMPFDKSYQILKDQCHIDMIYDPSGLIKGDYTIEMSHQILPVKYKVAGKFENNKGRFRFLGNCNDVNFEGVIQLFPEYVFQSFCAKRGDDLLIDLSTDPDDPVYVVGSVDFSVIQEIVPEPFKMSFAQEGSFVFRGYFKNGISGATVQTHYAHIRVPYIYNVIQNVTATCEFNIYEKNIVFKDIDVELYEGKISCSHANVFFDKNFSWCFVHAPLLLHDVMLSWNKGVYGLVSGRILLNKVLEQEPLKIEGQLMVQKAELKENIFSTEFQEILSGINSTTIQNDHILQPYVDISLFTKDPLQITTSFLTAKAVIDVRLQGQIQKTELSGSMRLLSGVLNFPYKPLEIVEGKLLFVPEQPFDPIIEFVAKGKLKRFHVSLKSWGSAFDPHVQFESEPYLSEEQIVSLLLLGVEDQSLSMMVPAFLTQRLKDIIFGPALSNVKLKSVFDRLLQSLKYVRFIPQFTNQTGRGGVRGIFEIDATEHLQAKIDTNFAQLEDTKFDVDYAATDDVTFRLQKDGPSTYGGQVEFRWKFS